MRWFSSGCDPIDALIFLWWAQKNGHFEESWEWLGLPVFWSENLKRGVSFGLARPCFFVVRTPGRHFDEVFCCTHPRATFWRSFLLYAPSGDIFTLVGTTYDVFFVKRTYFSLCVTSGDQKTDFWLGLVSTNVWNVSKRFLRRIFFRQHLGQSAWKRLGRRCFGRICLKLTLFWCLESGFLFLSTETTFFNRRKNGNEKSMLNGSAVFIQLQMLIRKRKADLSSSFLR